MARKMLKSGLTKMSSLEIQSILLKKNDFIIFKRVGSEEKIKCTVERKILYKSVKELLEAERTEHTLSSTNNIEKGIKLVESIGNYKKLITKNGVFAIKLKDVEVLHDS